MVMRRSLGFSVEELEAQLEDIFETPDDVDKLFDELSMKEVLTLAEKKEKLEKHIKKYHLEEEADIVWDWDNLDYDIESK